VSSFQLKASEKIIVALDGMETADAIVLAQQLKGYVWGFKINDLFINAGPEVVSRLKEFGEVFLDLKFHDIPATVANYAKKVAGIPGVKIFNVHASGGAEMIKEAVKNKGNCEVFAVTILTSLSNEDCQRIYGIPLKEKVIQLAREAKEAGVEGIVCSATDLEFLNKEPDLKDLKKITPGIRPNWAVKGDQKRITTPAGAIEAGAYKLVIGRPITKPPPEIGTPVEAAKKIAEEIEKALIERLLIERNAIWTYKEMPGEPHALLASGKHSDGYINLNAVLQSPRLSEVLANQLIEKLEERGSTKEKIDLVASSSYAAITFGYEVARQLGVDFVFTEKEGEIQKWSGRFEIPPGSQILQVEELITTLSTTQKVKKAILEKNPDVKFLEANGKTVVATIVHRPDHLPIEYPEYQVIALLEKEIHNWGPNECPLCKGGSEALKPKQNWQRFIEH
jgi:orotidine-5'-phosphate decarboxylase